MNKPFACILLLVIIMLFVNCREKKENAVIFVKEEPVKEDAVKAWLHKAENYKKSDKYLMVFYNYYDQKIKAKKYLNAAEILDIACVYLADSYDFNDRFLAKVKEFDSKYREKVPALKTTFVDAYLANYYFDKYNLKKACQYFKKITTLEPYDYNSCYNIARAYYDLSYIYYIMGKQNLSLLANQKSFEYFTKINNPKGLAFVYSNYANIYTAIGDKKRAIENADKAIQAYKKIDNTYNVYIGLINKISIYEYLKDERERPLIDSVYQAFTESKDESKILKIKLFDFKIENLIHENKLSEAKKIIDDLKPIVEDIDSDDLTQEYKLTSALYEIKKNPNYSNFEDFKKALPTLISNQQYEKVNMVYGLLQKNAIQNKDYKDALNYESKKKIIADSIGNIITRIKTVELEKKYQTEKKVQQLKIKEQTITNKNTTIALLGATLIGILFISFAFNLIQKQKKLRLEKQNAQLYTKQLLEKTEEERKRIASDLHDSVSHELLSLKNSLEQKAEITNQKIDAIINDIRSISRNLHPVMFDKIGLKESINQMVERAESVNDFMVTAEIDYHSVLSSSDELQIYRIVQEALSNIIKYADAIAAKISITENENSIIIEIKDNGKGFNVEETLNSKSSFGLHNIIERSRAIGGHANITSNTNGTIITIEIKKA
ncbi:tetratricopeptide repeat-containing sensor histidine kinase [Flavobacterium flavigenum]|uniref:tetratricopeptide repeat-containing sensor histidine kinase n=1 Tax=Flavobacterium flavigenum TaxID=3003258 RepID=UPI0024831467|nr:sensor histidine kinase [Flavobacterium flavigenum]